MKNNVDVKTKRLLRTFQAHTHTWKETCSSEEYERYFYLIPITIGEIFLKTFNRRFVGKEKKKTIEFQQFQNFIICKTLILIFVSVQTCFF